MVQPKYDPKEVLQRAKLLMKYDTSKTLTENTRSVKTINEEAQLLNEIAPLVLYGLYALAAGTLAAGATYGQMSNWFQGDVSAEKKIKSLSAICDVKNNLPKEYKFLESVISKMTLPPSKSAEIAATIRNAANYWAGTDEEAMLGAIGIIVKNGFFGDWCEVRRQFDEDNPENLEKTIIDELDGIDQNKVVGLLGQIISKSKKTIATKSDQSLAPNHWIETFGCLTDVGAFPQGWENDIKVNRFGQSSIPVLVQIGTDIKQYRLQQDGKLYFSLDGKFAGVKVTCNGDSISWSGTLIKESQEKKNNIEEQLHPPTPKTNTTNTTNKPKPKVETFVNCVGLYRPGCKSKTIEKVQACLKLKVDGKYTKELDDYLEYQFGLRSFTDKQVQMICDKTGYWDYETDTVEKPEVEKPEVDKPETGTSTTNANKAGANKTGYEEYEPVTQAPQSPAQPTAPTKPNSPVADKKTFYPNPGEEDQYK